MANMTEECSKYLVWEYTVPPSYEPLWFEKLDLHANLEWGCRWWPICLYASAIYLTFVHFGPKWMQDRKPYDLKTPLIIWNSVFALFSVWALIRVLPELFLQLSSKNGFYRSVCVREFFNESSAFYGYWFLWSKLFEFGDTVFIVLRKRPLIFLHWFHHVTVLIGVWLSSFYFDPVGRWFGIINLFVHGVMYTYYAFRAAGFRIPRKIAMCVTILQISQMVIAVWLNITAMYYKYSGVECARSEEGIKIHLWMYVAYLFLFAHYFYKAYIQPKPKSKMF